MAHEIYYFSGTGNSLSLAKKIAERTNAALISIPSVIGQQSIKIAADRIGIVFPSYMAQLYGIPLMVENFVKKIENIGSKLIYAVCNCGGYEIVNALPPLENLSKLLRSCGGRLFAGYTVRLPMNNLSYSHIPVPIDKDSGSIIGKSAVKIENVCRCINGEKKEAFRFLRRVFNLILAPLYSLMSGAYMDSLIKNSKEPLDTKKGFRELMPLTDKSIYSDEKCNGCGICAKICPAGNIEIIEKKPAWRHKCEMCSACHEWCPAKAVHYWGRAGGIYYHHPDVVIADMIAR